MGNSRRGFLRELASAVGSAKQALEPPAPPALAPDFSDAELERYSRQLVLPEWGAAAQLAVSEASVLVIGAGALGAPVASYLAAAGVGRIGIVDDGVVGLSELQRQSLHFTPDVGLPRAESAAATGARSSGTGKNGASAGGAPASDGGATSSTRAARARAVTGAEQ